MGKNKQQQKKEYYLGDEFSILSSIVFRKYRCPNHNTVDYNSICLN